LRDPEWRVAAVSPDLVAVVLPVRLPRGSNEEPDGRPGHAGFSRCLDRTQDVALRLGPLLDRGAEQRDGAGE